MLFVMLDKRLPDWQHKYDDISEAVDDFIGKPGSAFRGLCHGHTNVFASELGYYIFNMTVSSLRGMSGSPIVRVVDGKVLPEATGVFVGENIVGAKAISVSLPIDAVAVKAKMGYSFS